MKFPKELRRQSCVAPHSHPKLHKLATKVSKPYADEAAALLDTRKHVARLSGLQQLLAADASQALLIVLQGMDAAGKDGTISHIFTGVNPQGCDVAQFKVPTPVELSHDFLWRIHQQVPAKGKICIFNRSHYEDVLVPLVHGGMSEKAAKGRYQEIVNFEQMLAQNGTTILKFFLHISQQEQTERLRERMLQRDKAWKLSAADLKERRFWPQYQKAYQAAIGATSRRHAPWFVVPADQKWYRNAVISHILVDTLEGMGLHYPKSTLDPKNIKIPK